MKKLLLLIPVILLTLTLSVTAAAAGITFTVAGENMTTTVESAVAGTYTATDLFENFKGVMPGDSLTQSIVVKNTGSDCDYVNIYLKANPHDEETNPLTISGETVATMTDFLSWLTMRIYNGDTLISESTPDTAGALADNLLLGTLRNGEELSLRVELDVPIELGNEYASRTGEVDWIFLVEGIHKDKLTVHKVWDDNNYPYRPSRVVIHLLKDGETADTVTLGRWNHWTYVWKDLDDRYEWTVVEDEQYGYDVTYTSDGGTIFIINHMDYDPYIPPIYPKPEPPEPSETEPEETVETEPAETEPDETEPEETETETDKPDEPEPPVVVPGSLTVVKKWDDNNSKDRPASVIVTLYNGETAVEKITLDETNNWTYTWENLSADGAWSVLETGIPMGYTPLYEADGDTVTITNVDSLLQTGQNDWLIPVLAGSGCVIAAVGFWLILWKKKKKDEEDEEHA